MTQFKIGGRAIVEGSVIEIDRDCGIVKIELLAGPPYRFWFPLERLTPLPDQARADADAAIAKAAMALIDAWGALPGDTIPEAHRLAIAVRARRALDMPPDYVAEAATVLRGYLSNGANISNRDRGALFMAMKGLDAAVEAERAKVRP